MNWNSFRNLWRKPWSPYRAAFVGAIVSLAFPMYFVYYLKVHGEISLLSSPGIFDPFSTVRTCRSANAAEILFTAPPLVGGLLGFVLWAAFRGIRRSRLHRAGKTLAITAISAFFVFASAFLVLSALARWSSDHYGVPADARLLADFDHNKSAIERLQTLFEKDKGGLADINPSPENRAVLDAAGIVRCNGWKGNEEYPVWLEGWMITDGEEKGYCYLTKRPAPLRSSLDGIVVPYSVTYTGYRHISGNWYLYYCHTAG